MTVEDDEMSMPAWATDLESLLITVHRLSLTTAPPEGMQLDVPFQQPEQV
jgi:hypothetical protein